MGNLKSIHHLLENGADPTIRDNDGNLPLDVSREEYLEVLKELTFLGAATKEASK